MTTIEFTMKNKFCGEKNAVMQVDFSVIKVLIEKTEATIYKVDKYRNRSLTTKKETINNPDSISYKVTEKLSLQVSTSRILTLVHNKYKYKYKVLLQNNKKLAKECAKLRKKIKKNNKKIEILLKRISELNNWKGIDEQQND